MEPHRAVLFVDDDRAALTAIRRALMDEPYECLFAMNATQALECLKNQSIDILVSDLCMPGINGLTLLKSAEALSPHTRLIAFSGHPLASEQLLSINLKSKIHLFKKPVPPNILKKEIRQALDSIKTKPPHEVAPF